MSSWGVETDSGRPYRPSLIGVIPGVALLLFTAYPAGTVSSSSYTVAEGIGGTLGAALSAYVMAVVFKAIYLYLRHRPRPLWGPALAAWPTFVIPAAICLLATVGDNSQ